jgi:hypothetical protein
MHVCIFRISMESQTVIRFLTPKGLCASAITTELRPVYKTEGLALSTVKWCKGFAERRTSLYHDLSCGRTLTNDLAEAISSMLKERRYLSCKVFCWHFRIAQEAYFRILRHTVGMKRFHLRWVPMPWTRITNQTADRVTLSHGILSVLQSVRSTGFHNVRIGDEQRFFLYYPRNSI